MRKLKLQMQVSIDGFVASPNGEMDWMTWTWDKSLEQYTTALTATVDTILLGRVTAEGFIPHWTAAVNDPEKKTADFAHKMVDTPKVVFTKTMENNHWSNTQLAKGNLAAEIAALKEQDGKDIIVYGGGTFVSSLIKEGLIDEYHLFVNPTILGNGMPIFQELQNRSVMKLVHAIPFDCGIVVMCYTPA